MRIVSNDPDPGDSEIVRAANVDNRTIVTRDEDFLDRRICTIHQGVIFIPHEINDRTVLLPHIFDCMTRLLESGRLNSLGHGTCIVTPNGIIVRTRDGEEYIPIGDI